MLHSIELLRPKPGDDPLTDKLQKEIDFVNKLLKREETENSDLKLKTESLE